MSWLIVVIIILLLATIGQTIFGFMAMTAVYIAIPADKYDAKILEQKISYSAAVRDVRVENGVDGYHTLSMRFPPFENLTIAIDNREGEFTGTNVSAFNESERVLDVAIADKKRYQLLIR